MPAGKKSAEVDAYISSFPKDVQQKLQQVRSAISSVIPEADEAVSYGIPTFKLNGNIVHFAAFKNHIGFYPTPSGIDTFAESLSRYKHAKGSVQFPLNEALPIELIQRMTRFRAEKMQMKSVATKNEKTSVTVDDFLKVLSKPAQRALQAKGISSIHQLAGFSTQDILNLHGVGPSAIPKLREVLQACNLNFKEG